MSNENPDNNIEQTLKRLEKKMDWLVEAIRVVHAESVGNRRVVRNFRVVHKHVEED